MPQRSTRTIEVSRTQITSIEVPCDDDGRIRLSDVFEGIGGLDESCWRIVEPDYGIVSQNSCYFDSKGTLRTNNGERSIFDDVDE